MTETPPAGDGAPKDRSEDHSEHRPQQQGSEDRSENGPISARPTDDELRQHLGAAVLLCWNDLSFSAQLRILAQTNDVIGTRPVPEARNEIVKLLLRHTKMSCADITARLAAKVRIFPELICPSFRNPLL